MKEKGVRLCPRCTTLARRYGLRSEAALASTDESWAESLWLGARSYERGGWYDLAIQHFLEYLGTRSTEDARRAEVAFHLARTYQASLDCPSAITHYESVIETHPRSTFGSQSHVLLARCYVETGLISEAKQQLLQVLAGDRNLDRLRLERNDPELDPERGLAAKLFHAGAQRLAHRDDIAARDRRNAESDGVVAVVAQHAVRRVHVAAPNVRHVAQIDLLIPATQQNAFELLDPTDAETLTLQTCLTYDEEAPRFVVVAERVAGA